jgi:hypothetical protein
MRWGEGSPRRASRHELAHHKVCKALGVSGFWEHDDKGNSFWASQPGDEFDAAVIEAAGYLTGGGDSANDRRAAKKFAKAAGRTVAEAEARARELL